VKSVISKLAEASKISPQEEFLLINANFVSEQDSLSFNGSPISWKAGTLPLSYSRKTIGTKLKVHKPTTQ